MIKVGILIGSKTDLPYTEPTLQILTEMGIEHELNVLSAHRKPQAVAEYSQQAKSKGIEVIIAMAGGAAALPGTVAAWTEIPVIGVPLPTSEVKGIDALYAIVQMPPGIPVGCVGIGEWGARNAAYLAASIVGLQDKDVRDLYESYRKNLREN